MAKKSTGSSGSEGLRGTKMRTTKAKSRFPKSKPYDYGAPF